jgi:hypothetical protein
MHDADFIACSCVAGHTLSPYVDKNGFDIIVSLVGLLHVSCGASKMQYTVPLIIVVAVNS